MEDRLKRLATHLHAQLVNALRNARHNRHFLHLALVVEAADLAEVSQQI